MFFSSLATSGQKQDLNSVSIRLFVSLFLFVLFCFFFFFLLRFGSEFSSKLLWYFNSFLCISCSRTMLWEFNHSSWPEEGDLFVIAISCESILFVIHRGYYMPARGSKFVREISSLWERYRVCEWDIELNTSEIPDQLAFRCDLLCNHNDGDLFTSEDNMLPWRVKLWSFSRESSLGISLMFI